MVRSTYQIQKKRLFFTIIAYFYFFCYPLVKKNTYLSTKKGNEQKSYNIVTGSFAIFKLERNIYA